jgi:Ca2+-binding EF-hand superfamily protein
MTEKAIAKGEELLHTHDNPFHVKTNFFDQKIRTLFARFDFDGNGRIEKEDFETWCNNLAKAGNLNAERTAHLHQSIVSIWDAYFLPADTNHDGSVEYLELLDHMKAV